MNPVHLIIFSYILVVLADSAVVLHLHRKYGYIQYYKNVLVRQLMYLVIFSIVFYFENPFRYLVGFPNITLALALMQFFLFFQIEFDGINDTKRQTVFTAVAIILHIVINFFAVPVELVGIVSLISALVVYLYLSKYNQISVEARVIFSLIWFSMGINGLIITDFQAEFPFYWIVIIVSTALTQSYISTMHNKSINEYLKYAENTRNLSFEELKDKLLEFVPVSLILTDYTSKILYVNPAVQSMTGYDSEELIGNYTRVFQSGETPPETYQSMWHTIKSGNTWKGTLKNKRKDGHTYWEDVTIIPITNSNNIITNYLGVKFDTSQEFIARRILETNANYDDLTGALRRNRFAQLVKETMLSKTHAPFYIVMIDIDKFKSVNDMYGHTVGDQLLVEISQEIKDVYPPHNSYFARYGGDEFVYFTYGLRKRTVMAGADEIRKRVNEIANKDQYVNSGMSVSIGVSKVSSTLKEAIDYADQHMYSDKKRS